jgi:hypothetical protein
MKKKKADELESGFTFDPYLGAVYHFEHVPLKDVEVTEMLRELPFIMETVNWTLADKKTVHRNKYFTFGLSDAIALAARIEIASIQCAENVIGIRPADEEESTAFRSALDHYMGQMPEAISDGALVGAVGKAS